MSHDRLNRIAFMGFGEAATAFVEGWDQLRPAHVSAFDIKSANAATRDVLLARYKEDDIDGAASAGEAVADVEAVFSLVTADQALVAAQSAASALAPGALWLDGNSCAPDTKRAAAKVIEAAGGRYVDVAIMSPVHPQRHRVPLLVSGPHAADAEAFLRALDMRPRIAGDSVGRASTIKMLRSVMVKGMEALTAECLLAARRAGVEDDVIASLEASNPEVHWRRQGAYNLERMMVHGRRRAAEMREVVLTVEALGLSGRMSAATAAWQDQIAELDAEPGEDDFPMRADLLLRHL